MKTLPLGVSIHSRPFCFPIMYMNSFPCIDCCWCSVLCVSFVVPLALIRLYHSSLCASPAECVGQDFDIHTVCMYACVWCEERLFFSAFSTYTWTIYTLTSVFNIPWVLLKYVEKACTGWGSVIHLIEGTVKDEVCLCYSVQQRPPNAQISSQLAVSRGFWLWKTFLNMTCIELFTRRNTVQDRPEDN